MDAHGMGKAVALILWLIAIAAFIAGAAIIGLIWWLL